MKPLKNDIRSRDLRFGYARAIDISRSKDGIFYCLDLLMLSGGGGDLLVRGNIFDELTFRPLFGGIGELLFDKIDKTFMFHYIAKLRGKHEE